MSMKPEQWDEAKRRCRLSDDEIRMAKELGMQPRSLIKNIPTPSQQWKAPVKEWVRSLYEKKFGASPPPPPRPQPRPDSPRPKVLEFRDPAWPWPDRPEIPDLIVDMSEDFYEFEEPWRHHEPPDEEDIAGNTSRMIRHQYLYRWGAQSVAHAMAALPEVRKVASFGAVAKPLRTEVPRFYKYRRYRIELPHECADIDLAVWLDHFSRLRELKQAVSRGLRPLQDSPYGGIAHHQVDVHLFEAEDSEYRGRLCIFGQCPKPGKRECLVPRCGEEPFLRQFRDYRFDATRFELEPKVLLFDRATGFLVREPVVEDTNPARIIESPPDDDEGYDDEDEDIPF